MNTEADGAPPDHIDLNTVMAMAGDRTASIQMWAQVAKGEFTAESKSWLKHVAESLLDAESKDAGRLRDGAIVRAVGLAGSMDKHRNLRQLAKALNALPGEKLKRRHLVELAKYARLSDAKAKGASFSGALGHDPNQYKFNDNRQIGNIVDAEIVKPMQEDF